MKKNVKIRCFMDGIDWQYHLECDEQGSILYPSEKSLKTYVGHDLTECGIVEVEVRLIRWVEKQKIGKRNENL